MPQSDIISPMNPTSDLPVVRSIGVSDLKEILAKGFADFKAMPTHVIFLCALYPIVGIFMARMSFGYDVVPLLYPLAAGFAIVGPIAGVGLCELSRRRELGMDTSWKHAFDVLHSPSLPHIAAVALLLLFLYIIWVVIAHSLYVANFGYAEPKSVVDFAQRVISTPEGRNLIIAGNAVGLVFAVLALTMSVVSFPLLLDRNVGATAALITSGKAVLKNPITMALWGLIVAIGLVLGSLPFFIGLAIVMPVLGHSTWHLYRKVIEPDPNPRPEYHPRQKTERFGAQFPASLFFPSSRDKNPE